MNQHVSSSLIFTKHALERMGYREIQHLDAEIAFRYGTQTRQDNDTAITYTMDLAACERVDVCSIAPSAYGYFGVTIVVVNGNVVKTAYRKEEVAA